jgi:NAD dependent epimerase/dehydratase family enzyme
VSNDEFGKTISKVMKRPHYFQIPGFAMKLAFGEVSTMVLEGQKVLPEKLLEAGYSFKYPKLEDALKELLKK